MGLGCELTFGLSGAMPGRARRSKVECKLRNRTEPVPSKVGAHIGWKHMQVCMGGSAKQVSRVSRGVWCVRR